MNQHWEKKLLVVWFFLLLGRVYSAKLVKDGPGKCSTYQKSTYRAFNYRPFCGTLAQNEDLPWSYKGVCAIPMELYRPIPDTFAVYDLTGVRLPDTFQIGAGTEVCMCYSIGEVPAGTAAPIRANFCTFVDKTGAEEMYAFSAQGTYEVGSKSMPHCFDVDTAAVTASLAAGLTVTAATRTGAPGATGTSGGSTQGNNGESAKSNPPGGPFAIGIWLPIVISAIAAGFGIYYRRKHYRLHKARADKPGEHSEYS